VKKLLILVTLLIGFAAAGLAPAQPSGAMQSIAPLTRNTGALITLTGANAGTTNSADVSGYNVSRVVCVFRQSTYTNSPSTTFKIQNKDSVSGQYYDLVQSSAVTTSTSAIPLAAGAGVATASNLSIGMPISAAWRVSVTVGGTTPVVTGTVACSIQ